MDKQSVESLPERIALYGGAFDPVHCAHLEVARAALENANLDRVFFIPAAQSPLKQHGPHASDAERLEMLRLAIADEKRFSIDRCELDRGGVSYSLDTVRFFREKYPKADFFWILGADQFTQLADWRAADALAAELCFLVLARPGFELKAPEIQNIRFERVPAPEMEPSSTEIRARLKNGDSLNDWLPSAVEAFISKQRLYR